MNHDRVRLLVRTDVHRRLRAVGDRPSAVLGFAIAGLFGSLMGVAVIAGAFFAGRAVAAGDLGPRVDVVGSVVGGILALVIFTTGLRVVQQSSVPATAEHVLLAADHREVVAALVVVESLLPLALVGLPGILASLLFALGAGSPASAVLVAASVLALVAVGVLAGFVVGLGVRNAVARVRLLARFRTAIGFLLAVGYVVVIFGTGFENVLGPVLAGPPLAWFGDLALLAILPSASPLRAAGALVTTGIGLVVLGWTTSRLAAALWYSRPVDPGGSTVGSSTGRLPWVNRTTSLIAWKAWARARRSPIRLVYVIYPLLFAIGPIASAGLGDVPRVAVPAIVVYGGWATGSAFTLNPIGDETPVLPITLTSGVGGRRFVRSLWFAGAVVGAPATVALAVAAGLAAGLGVVDLVAAGVLGLAVAGLAPGVAAGIGAMFPRTEPARVGRSRRVVVPSLVAFAGYSIGFFVLSMPVWLALAGSTRGAVAGVVGLSPGTILLLAGAVSIGLLAVAAFASYRSAAGRFDAYTVP